MKMILVKSRVGFYIGQTQLENLSDIETKGTVVIEYPCLLDFLPTPVQGAMGQTTIAAFRFMVAWPALFLKVGTDNAAISIIVESDLVPVRQTESGKLIEAYKKTMKEAWNINL